MFPSLLNLAIKNYDNSDLINLEVVLPFKKIKDNTGNTILNSFKNCEDFFIYSHSQS